MVPGEVARHAEGRVARKCGRRLVRPGAANINAAMSRVVLAFACFFRVLFGKQLPPEAAKLLPEEALRKALPAPAKTEAGKSAGTAGTGAATAATAATATTTTTTTPAKEPEKRPEPAVEKPRASAAQHHKDGALALLALLQREGRLVDFLTEAIDDAPDDAIGAAVREVHRGCRKVIEQYLAMEPVMPGEEGAKASVPKGFDPAEIRLIGEAKGEPPYSGTLRHHGWRVVDAKLPALADGVDRTVVAPAEVELPA